MRQLAIALLLMIPSSSVVWSQTPPPRDGWEMVLTDTLRVYDSKWSLTGFKYKYGDEGGEVGLGAHPVKRIVAANPQAYAEVRKFAYYEVSTFIVILGSAAVLGWGIGSDDSDLIVGGIVGIVVGSIFDRIGYSHLKKGARIFNAGLRANGGISEVTPTDSLATPTQE